MRYNRRQHKISQLKSWLEKKSTHNRPIDESALDSLTLKQATAVLTLVARTYSAGCEDTRQWRKNYRAGVARYEGRKPTALSLVQGGAV
jgi:hypothetical protein